jgi:hypothetical protein
VLLAWVHGPVPIILDFFAARRDAAGSEKIEIAGTLTYPA